MDSTRRRLRVVTVALAVKALIARVSDLPGRLPDLGRFEAPLARVLADGDRIAPLMARAQAARQRIEAVVAIWQRIGSQAGYTARAASAAVRELS